jgi:hypothetical protein
MRLLGGERRRRMPDEILVEPQNPVVVKPDELRGFVEDLRGIRQDAFIAYHGDPRVPGRYGVTWWEVVSVWVGLRVSEAVIEQVVGFAVSWMRERFHNHPATRDRPKAVRIIKYDGETGTIVETVELRSADAEAVRKTPEAFEMYTRKKPPVRRGD